MSSQRTRFRYQQARLDRSRITAGESARVRVRVANTGDRDGEEVVQLYVARPDADGAPRQSLAGFKRIALKAGEARDMEFEIAARALSVVAVNGTRSVPAGVARIWVGGGQPNLEMNRSAPGAGLELTIDGARGISPY